MQRSGVRFPSAPPYKVKKANDLRKRVIGLFLFGVARKYGTRSQMHVNLDKKNGRIFLVL
jgi:hypothetical protein